MINTLINTNKPKQFFFSKMVHSVFKHNFKITYKAKLRIQIMLQIKF